MHNAWRHGPTGYHLKTETGWSERERHYISINYLQVTHCIYSCSVIKMKQESSISVFSAERCVRQWSLILDEEQGCWALFLTVEHLNDARCHGFKSRPHSHSSALESPPQEDILQAALQRRHRVKLGRFYQGPGHGPQPRWHWSLIQWLHFSRTHFSRGRFAWSSFPA